MRNTDIDSDRRPHPEIIRKADRAAIADAAAALRAGMLVAFPTETVYGVGADAGNAEAVARLYRAKGRPSFNPLIVHVADLASAERIGMFDASARRLAEAFWPGPLTVVVPLRPDAAIADIVTAGLKTVGLRVPDAAIAHALIAQAGVPIAAPSANRSGHVSATTAGHAAADLGAHLAMVLDGGAALHGIESTIVGIEADGTVRLLRPGAITRQAIEAVLGHRLAESRGEEVDSPGQLAGHYAPRARLRLNALERQPGEAFIGFGPPPPGVEPTMSLSEGGDPVEAAARLFSVLRSLDDRGIERAAIMPIPNEGLGEAINDRLARAAAAEDRSGGTP